MEPIDDNTVSMTLAELNAMANLMDEALKEIIRLKDLSERALGEAQQWRKRAELVATAWKNDDAKALETHAMNILLWLWTEPLDPDTPKTNQPEEGQ